MVEWLYQLSGDRAAFLTVRLLGLSDLVLMVEWFSR
jgi:hypothetical protein